MRLIDADALKQGFESSDFDDDPFENVDNACRIVNSYPTIPAIQVEWLEKVQTECVCDVQQIPMYVAIGWLRDMWQKEQGAR